MAKLAVPLTLLAVLMASGCGSTAAEMPMRIEYSKTTSFHEWKTFRFTSENREGDYTRYPKFDDMAQQALEEELTARGYERIEDGTPDFRVAFDLIFRGEKTSQTAPEGGGADPMARAYSGARQSGSLTVRMLDPASSQVLWTGYVSEIRVNSLEPTKEIKKAVWRLLVEFPPLTG